MTNNSPRGVSVQLVRCIGRSSKPPMAVSMEYVVGAFQFHSSIDLIGSPSSGTALMQAPTCTRDIMQAVDGR